VALWGPAWNIFNDIQKLADLSFSADITFQASPLN
jgi:hypothetical protein